MGTLSLSPYMSFAVCRLFSLWGARGGTQDPTNTRHVLLRSSTPSPVSDSQPALSIPESFILGTPMPPLYTSIWCSDTGVKWGVLDS